MCNLLRRLHNNCPNLVYLCPEMAYDRLSRTRCLNFYTLVFYHAFSALRFNCARFV